MAVKAFSASGYQNECSVHTACLNSFWLSGVQEIGKLTSPVTFGDSPSLAVLALTEIGNMARMAAATMPYRRLRVMAMSSAGPRPVLTNSFGGFLLCVGLNQNSGCRSRGI